LAALSKRFRFFGHHNRVNAIRLATQHVPHPVIFLLLCIPFGAATGYVSVTLVYLLSHAGVSVASVAGMLAISLLPQTWKVLWAPIVDTTLTSKRWYLIAAFFTAATLAPIGFLPMTGTMLAAITALVFTNSVATTFLAMATENLMARATGLEEKGRAGGWYQAGNLGGAGIGGGAALWLAQHSAIIWLPGAAMAGLCAACCIALWFAPDAGATSRNPRYLESLRGVLADVWAIARSRVGFLALLICFLPIGSGAASGLW